MLEEETLELIEMYLSISKNPVCLCSFGKDSLTMLHLIRRVKKVPVIFFREPFFQSKFIYPQKIASEWELDVYDYPPSAIHYIQLDNYFDVYNFYYVDGKTHLVLYTGVRKYVEGDTFLCAVGDLLLRPKVQRYEFKWDCIFHGHKQSDPIYLAPSIPLPISIPFGPATLVLPIREWTDEDIWGYIKKHNVPYNKERYEEKDERANGDIFPTCYDCLDYRLMGRDIVCPKKHRPVPFVGRTKEQNMAFRDELLKICYKS